jgi:T5SS/PEP-CTERM-associated repeat protein
MAASTWTWLGLSDIVNASTNWALDSGTSTKGHPSSGDTAIFTGTSVAPAFVDTQLSGGVTIDLIGGGTVQFLNDTGFFNTTSIDPSITINATGTATSFVAEGTVSNSGTIEVTGTGNRLTIDIASDVGTGATQTGWLENDGSIVVNAGDQLTVAATAGAIYAGFGTVYVNGGAALIDAAMPTFGNDANFSISQGGSLEIGQTGTSAQPNISFNGSGVLKLDQPGSFAGTINGFALGDTIDLGILNVTSVVYDNQGDIFLIGTNGGTVFASQTQGGELGGNGPGTFTLSGTGGVAGDVIVTEGNGGETVLTATPPRTWLWAPGVSASANTPGDFSVLVGLPYPDGNPGQGDTVINASGTVVSSGGFNLQNNTIELGGTAATAALLVSTALAGSGGNDNGQTPSAQNPTIDQNSVIESQVNSVGTVFTGNSMKSSSLLGVNGLFVNEGSVLANAAAGSSFTIAVSATNVVGTAASTLVPGYFINYSQIDVDPGNAMTITVGANSEFFNVSEILVNGGSLLFQAAAGAIDGGYAGGDGVVVIIGGGTVETNAAYPSGSTSTVPVYAFADAAADNTLKIDNIGSFGGVILAFGQNDTIDLGTSIAVSSLSYQIGTGILTVHGGGSIAATLLLGSGNFTNSSFIVGTSTVDGDTILTTGVQNDVFSNTSGSWQAGGLWSTGVPGTLDTTLIGFGASGSATLTTGSLPVTAGAPIMVGGLLQITSPTTFNDYPIRAFGGTIEVTGGNTLTATQLSTTGGTVQIDPTGTIDLTGHAVYGGTGAVNNTIVASTINPRALSLGGGDFVVDGGVLNAGTGVPGGDGGAVLIGVDSGGMPASATLQSNGANAATASALYTELGSDPTGYGVLTLNGNGTAGGATWTDQIDPAEAASNTTGFMVVGYDNQGTLAGTVTPPPFAGTATLQVENGATLTEQTYAIVGQSYDSAGSVDVVGGLWNIGTGSKGGFLVAGDSAGSSGTLLVDSGGTVAIGQGGTFLNAGSSFTGSGISVGLAAQSNGTIIAQNGGQITVAAGVNIGTSGQGLLQVLNGGTIALTGTNGISTGGSAGGVGTLLVSGNNGSASLVNFTETSKGITAGASGQGTVDVENGGTILMNGTGGISVGQSANASGVVIVNGPFSTINQGAAGSGMGIAQAGSSTGSVLVENGGTIALNGTGASSGVRLGQAAGANGTLDIEAGGTVQVGAPANIIVGQSAGASGLLIVNGVGAALNVGTVVGGTVTGASLGFVVGDTGTGTVTIENGGTVQFDSTAGSLRDGGSGNGMLTVTGTGSSLTFNTPNNPENVGIGGSGTLNVLAGGSFTANNQLGIGAVQSTGTGVVLVNGAGSSITLTGTHAGLSVGGPGQGNLTIDGGGFVSDIGTVSIGSGVAGTTGTVTVGGTGALSGGALTAGGLTLNIGVGGTGLLSVLGGGSVSDTSATGINLGGFGVGGTGTIAINGGTLSAGSSSITVGNSTGSGSLSISGGGLLTAGGPSAFAVINASAGGAAVATVSGGIWNQNGQINVGQSSGGAGSLDINSAGTVNAGGNSVFVGQSGGTGTLSLESGGSLQAGAIGVGTTLGGAGTLEVAGGTITAASLNESSGGTISVGAGSLAVNGFVAVGQSGVGAALTVTGGAMSTGNFTIAQNALSTGDVAVSGGSLTVSGLTVGAGGAGTLTVNSGQLTNSGSNSVVLGGFNASGSSGTLTINGGLFSDTGGYFGVGSTNASGLLTLNGGQLITGGGGAFADVNASGSGTALAQVNGGTWTASGSLIVGDTGGGTLSIGNGGVAMGGAVTIGQQTGGSGTLTMSGGTLSSGGQFTVGGQGSGSATIGSGASLIAGAGVAIAGGPSASGTLTVNGGHATTTGAVRVGNGGNAGLLIENGASFIANGSSSAVTQILVGSLLGGSGSLIVSNGVLNGTNEGLFVGDGGNGSMLIESGGTVNTSFSAGGPGVDVNASNGAQASAQVLGARSVWNLTSAGGQFVVGDGGNGSVSVTGGVVNAGANVVDIGNQSGGAGTVSVSSGGTFDAAAASAVSSAFIVGSAAGASGSLSVTGAGSKVTATGQLTVGGGGTGALLIASGATVLAGDSSIATSEGVDVGQVSGGSGGITVTGTQSVLSNTGKFIVGDGGLGTLTVASGGTLITSPGGVGGLAGLVIAATAGAAGSSVGVTGAGSQVNVTGLLDVGVGGSGALEIDGGATVTAATLDAGNVATAIGLIGVSDPGSEMIVSGSATVADDGTGVLSVLNGATFSAQSLTIGSQTESSGALVVSGNGSMLSIAGELNIGTAAGTGDLTVGPGATVNASVVNLQGGVVLEGGVLDPTVYIENGGSTTGGYGTVASDFILLEGTILSNGGESGKQTEVVRGTLVGGGTADIKGSVSVNGPGILQIGTHDTIELTGAVLNAATTTFTDNLTPTGTYTVNNSVIDVVFQDSTGVLQLDNIGGFAGTVATWHAGDAFVATSETLSALAANGNTLTVHDSGPNAGAGGIDTIIFGSAIDAGGFSIVGGDTIVACFAEGTRIQTAAGLVAVEALAVGDDVTVLEGGCENVVWIGQRTVNCRAHPAPETVWPVRVRAGAFGENVPVCDLYLSPDHAVFVNDVLVPVKLLIDGDSIVQVRRDRVRYFHVELPRHSVILAEGLTVESYLDAGDRANFEDGTVIRLFADFAGRLETAVLWEAQGVAPLVQAGEALAAARRCVAERSGWRSASAVL